MSCSVVIPIIVCRAALRVSQSEDRFVDRRWRRKLPRYAAITGTGEVVGDAGTIGKITATQDAVLRIVEGNAESSSGGPGNERRGIRIPRVATISSRDHACRSDAAGCEPGALASLGRDAGSARGKTGFA